MAFLCAETFAFYQVAHSAFALKIMSQLEVKGLTLPPEAFPPTFRARETRKAERRLSYDQLRDALPAWDFGEARRSLSLSLSEMSLSLPEMSFSLPEMSYPSWGLTKGLRSSSSSTVADDEIGSSSSSSVADDDFGWIR